MKGKGKGPPPKSLAKPKSKAGGLPAGKPEIFGVFFTGASLQRSDGAWEAKAILNSGAYAPAEHEEFEAQCPLLSTLMMLEIGRRFEHSMFEGHTTKQVHEVKLGDGRSKPDEVKVALVELTEEELQERRAGWNEALERAGVGADWASRAEAWLERQAGRDAARQKALEETAQRFRMVIGRQQKHSPEDHQKVEEARQAKQEELRAKEEARLLVQRRRLEHFRSLPPAELGAVQWLQMRDLHFLDGGCGGVLLVDLGTSCVVLKQQSKTAASEMLAQVLAETLVNVARARIVKRGEEEFDEIQAQAVRCCEQGADIGLASYFILGLSQEEGRWQANKSSVNFFGVLEFVNGHALMGVEGQLALQDPGDQFLQDLGRLCAFDVLINNFDRVPLPVWQNEGNFG
ncbi:unnamed protein product, partial [Effrenium voratum]